MVFLEERENAAVKALVTVIEGEKYGLVRERLSALGCIHDVLIADHVVTRLLQPGKMVLQMGLADGHAIKGRNAFFFRDDVVVIERDEGIAGRLCREADP